MNHVDTDGIATAADLLQKRAAAIAAVLDQLDTDTTTLRSNWSGQAQQAFDRAHREWAAIMADLDTSLTAAAGHAHGAAEYYASVERDLRALWPS